MHLIVERDRHPVTIGPRRHHLQPSYLIVEIVLNRGSSISRHLLKQRQGDRAAHSGWRQEGWTGQRCQERWNLIPGNPSRRRREDIRVLPDDRHTGRGVRPELVRCALFVPKYCGGQGGRLEKKVVAIERWSTHLGLLRSYVALPDSDVCCDEHLKDRRGGRRSLPCPRLLLVRLRWAPSAFGLRVTALVHPAHTTARRPTRGRRLVFL